MKILLQIILILFTFSCVNKKERIFKKIESLGFPDKEIVVSLDDFFDGNDDYASIGPNIYENQPSPQEFYDTFKELIVSKDADEILVRISDVEGLDWPFTDVVYIISSQPLDDIKEKVTHLQPDEIYDGWMYGKPVNAGDVPSGKKVYSLWWD
jgi:hypothetical protein